MWRKRHPNTLTPRLRISHALAGIAIGVCACNKATEPTRSEPPATNIENVRAGSAGATGAASPAGATSRAGAASSGTGSSMQSTLAVKLLASPRQLSMAERSKFMVGVEVVNHGSTAVDPQLSTGCRLTVNGEPSMSWNLAIGNGAREASWYMLPPGKTATMSWPLGTDLFDKPGDYHLVMTIAGQQSTADIHVTK
jgi:hypothetical protein